MNNESSDTFNLENYGQIGAVGNQNDVKWFNSSDN
jgi:hypothetical protein